MSNPYGARQCQPRCADLHGLHHLAGRHPDRTHRSQALLLLIDIPGPLDGEPMPGTTDIRSLTDAASRGFPSDASEVLRTDDAAYGGLPDVHGTTWITWSEPAAADWQRTDSSGTRRRDSVAGDETHWGPVWSVMRTLSELHGADRS